MASPASPSLPLPRVGAHISIAGGHAAALRLARSVGCEVVQVFTKNNMQWAAPPLRREELAEYRATRTELGYEGSVFAHAGYLINLAGADETNLARSRESLLAELERCTALDLPFLVVHPGSHKGRGVEAGLAAIEASLDWVFARYFGATRIAFEFTAGQGDCLGRSIAEIAALVRGRHRDRLAVCLDTCHVFAAGYDIRGAGKLEAFVAEIKREISWEKVVCTHLNDSVGALGSRRDRHALLGEGEIGWPTFAAIVKHPAFAKVPLCLETPKGEANGNDIASLARLKKTRAATRAKSPTPSLPASRRIRR